MNKETWFKLVDFLDMLESDERVAQKFGYRKAEQIVSEYRQAFQDLLKEIEEEVES